MLCGRIAQCVASFQHLIQSVRGRLSVALQNEETKEELVVTLSPTDDKVEVSRHAVGKFTAVSIRPVGQAVR